MDTNPEPNRTQKKGLHIVPEEIILAKKRTNCHGGFRADVARGNRCGYPNFMRSFIQHLYSTYIIKRQHALEDFLVSYVFLSFYIIVLC